MKFEWPSGMAGFGPTAWNRGGPPVIIPMRSLSKNANAVRVRKSDAESIRIAPASSNNP
jgi:hypothetical protein